MPVRNPSKAALPSLLLLRPGELALILAPKGTGKSTLSAAMLPRRVTVAPAGASLPPGPAFKVLPEKWRVAFALSLALRFMGAHKIPALLLDDADTLYDLDPAAVEHVVAHCRNWGIVLAVQGKTPARIGPFVRDSADLVIYRPGREAHYRRWGTDNGFPDSELAPFTFWARRSEALAVVDSSGRLIRTM